MNGGASPAALLSLEDRVALVSGGSGGIGSAVVRTLLDAGAEVASVDLPDKPPVAGAVGLGCDLADAASIEEMFARFRDRFDRLDVFVHCAGIIRDAVLWKMEEQAWSQVMRVNLDSAFLILRRAVPLMRERGNGAVVLVSSINGQRGSFGQANYSASKAGLIGLGRTAAFELGRFGIRVNVIAPGMTATSMTANLPEGVLEAELEESALGKIGQPEHVAHAALFLVSAMSAHVTGQVLRVDGGVRM